MGDIPRPKRLNNHLKYVQEDQQLEDIITPVQIYAAAKMISMGMNEEPELDSSEKLARERPLPSRFTRKTCADDRHYGHSPPLLSQYLHQCCALKVPINTLGSGYTAGPYSTQPHIRTSYAWLGANAQTITTPAQGKRSGINTLCQHNLHDHQIQFVIERSKDFLRH